MKHPNRVTEAFEYNIGKAIDLRCSSNSTGPLCGNCESCQVKEKLSSVKNWFDRASDQTKRRFLLGIVKRLESAELLRYAVHLLQPLSFKDATYAYGRSFPSLPTDRGTISGDRVLDEESTLDAIKDVWQWFLPANYWTKVNFVLVVFQLCQSHLLYFVNLVTKALLQKLNGVDTFNFSDDLEDSFIESTDHDISSEDFSKYDSVEAYVQALVPFQASTDDQAVPNSSTSSEHLEPTLQNEDEDEFGEDDKDFPMYGGSQFKDFMKFLPVNVSKYILSLLDRVSLYNCLCVSQKWRTLVEEVSQDSTVSKQLKQEIKLMQGSSTFVCNPQYAADVLVAVPKLVPHTWQTIPSEGTENPGQIHFSKAYEGYVTRNIIMEERNVFCGSYNVMIVTDNRDPSRVVGMDTGNLIAIGAKDRRIKLINTENCLPLDFAFSGHAGSIKCVLINEKKGFIISSSYDTSIRKWSLLNKKCLKIYNGHMDTVSCIKIHNSYLVSGAKDRTCKVWNLESGKCLRTFKHKKPVSAVAIFDEICVSGSMDSQVKVWHIPSGKLIKRLSGHHGSITCIAVDRWHIVTSALDGYVFVWSTQGDYKRCLTAFRHPKNVLCLTFMYLRVITGCADGKIRIWHIETGQCLRILRGNSHGDPVTQLTSANDKILINTRSSVLMLTFEPIEYDYNINEDNDALMQFEQVKAVPNKPPSHAHVRAQKMVRIGTVNNKIVHHNEKNTETVTEPAKSLKPLLESMSNSTWPRFYSSHSLATQSRMTCSNKPTVTPYTDLRLPSTNNRVAKSNRNSEFEYSDAGSSKDFGESNRRRFSWSFEHPVICDNNTASLSETKSLLWSQIRSTKPPKPPGFVSLTVDAIHSAQKPTEDDVNLESNRRRKELQVMKESNRPSTSPSRIDPRTKVLVKEMDVDALRFTTLNEEDKFQQNTKPVIASGIDRKSASYNEPKVRSITTPFVVQKVATNKRQSLHSGRIRSVIPQPMLLRPHTTNIVTTTNSDINDINDFRPRTSATDTFQLLTHKGSKRNTWEVPMLMYSKDMLTKLEELKEKQFERSLCIHERLKSTAVHGGLQSDPMRTNPDLKLLTYPQLQDEMAKITEEQEQFKLNQLQVAEKKCRSAWLAMVRKNSTINIVS